MRKIIPLIFSVLSSLVALGQANGGWGTCEFATVVAMNAYDPSGSNFSCKKVYVQATDEHYYWDGSVWVLVSDDQNASEVPFSPAGTISSTDVQAAIEEIEPDIYGSIDVHDDVDITTTPPSSGDLLVWDGSNFVPQATDNGYTIFNIFAEENAALGAGNYEWAYGNGSNTSNGDGIVIPIDCELFAMSLNHEGGANTVVRIVKNTDASLASYQVQTSGTENGYNTFGTPLSFSAGDIANFTTVSASASGTTARVSAWFRVRSTPASTSLLNDLLDVSAGGITSDQILQYDGSSFVPIDFSGDNITYDNSTSGLTATDVQAAIDEVALSSGNIYTTNGTLSADRTVTFSTYDLEMDLTSTGDFNVLDNGTSAFSVHDNGLVAIGNITPVAPLHIYEATGTAASASDGTIVIEHGNSGGESSIVFKSNVDEGSDYGYISYSDDGSGNGSTSQNSLLTIGVENNGSGSNVDDIAILPTGSLGVGTIAPQAKLDVDGGSVRFSDYGAGTYEDTTAVYLLGVESDGDVIEMNTAKSSRIFYPPALVIDASSTGTSLTLDLHQQYINLFGSPAVASSGAPSVIPTYAETELYYYVTDYDNTVFSNLSISAAGVLTYDIDAVPTDNCSVLNVVFVVKEP